MSTDFRPIASAIKFVVWFPIALLALVAAVAFTVGFLGVQEPVEHERSHHAAKPKP